MGFVANFGEYARRGGIHTICCLILSREHGIEISDIGVLYIDQKPTVYVSARVLRIRTGGL